MINLFYNYYITENSERQKEIDFCFKQNLDNDNIDNIFVYVEKKDLDITQDLLDGYEYKTTIIAHDYRPTFHFVMYNVFKENSTEDDINIMMNSDCFFGDSTDWELIKSMDRNHRFCLSRYDLSDINPITLDGNSVFPRVDSQDCWIIKGVPNEGLDIDFYFGMPGCDNRISYELSRDGYTVSGPVSKIKVYHYHVTNLRTYNVSKDRIDGMYRLINLS